MVSYGYVADEEGNYSEVLILIVVDNGLVHINARTYTHAHGLVLILIVVDNGLVLSITLNTPVKGYVVLILIVVDNGLVLIVLTSNNYKTNKS